MKRKITQIGKLFAAAALFFGASSWASAQETVTATWLNYDESTSTMPTTATISAEGVFANNAITLGAEQVVEGGTKTVGQDIWPEMPESSKTFMKYGTATVQIPQNTEIVRFTLTPAKGVTFTPTKVSLKGFRDGHGNGAIAVVLVSGSTEKVLIDNQELNRNKNEEGYFTYTLLDLPVSDFVPEEGEDISVVIKTGSTHEKAKIDANKYDGFADVVIEGTYTAAEPAKVAYLCGANAVDCNEAIYKALTNSGLNVTPLNFDEVSLTGDLAADGLADYDLVVIAGPTGSGVALAKTFDKIVGKVPVLSTKAFWYNKTSPAFGGGGVNPGSADKPSMALVRTELYEGHTIYSGIEGDTIMVFANAGRDGGRYLQGIPTSGNVYEHTVLGTANGSDCVAEFWADGVGYVIVPLDGEGAEYTVLDGALTAEGAQLFVNAANYLLEGEKYEVPYFGDCAVEISTVALEGEFAGQYQLNITATPDTAKIYYTTDGTVPTTSSKLYTAPDTIVKNCLIQAIAVADKWRDSAIDSLEFVNTSIATLPAPTFTVAQDAANHCATVTIVALAAEYTGYNFYYTTDGSTPTENSALYTEPFNFYGDSMTVKAIAVGDLYNTSAVGEQVVINENHMAREKVAFTCDFHTPKEEWFYFGEWDPETGDPVDADGSKLKGQLTQEDQDAGLDADTDNGHYRVHVFSKGNTYVGYRQYNGWSFYGETNRRIILQDNKGIWFLNASGKTSVAPDTLFAGPFDIEIEIKDAKQESVFNVYAGDELEGDTWELIGTTTITSSGTVKASYNGSGKKYVRVETTAKEFYMNKYTVKVPGYGALKLESISPAGGEYATPAILADSVDTFVLTFNNPLAAEQTADLLVFFAAPNLPTHNCTYAIDGNKLVVTRPNPTEALAAGTYQFVVRNVADVAGQVLEGQVNVFYMVEAQSSSVTAPEVEKEVVSTVIYSISGAVQSELTQGLNFVRTVYSDGSVEVEKVIVK